MIFKTQTVAIATAAAIALGSLVPTAAQAMPLSGLASADIQTGTPGVEDVQRRGRRFRRGRGIRRGRGFRRGRAIGAGVALGAFALGAAAAASAARNCHFKRVRVWSDFRGHYVVRRHKVCY